MLECHNLSCRKHFGFVDRKHHCRRCGNIFCSNCLSFEVKLSKEAELDVCGITCKVCIGCYEDFQLILGDQQKQKNKKTKKQKKNKKTNQFISISQKEEKKKSI